MSYDAVAKKLYTTRTTLYHWFIYSVGYARAVKKYIAQSQQLKSSMRILDAGCGGGLVTQIMHDVARHQNTQNISFFGFDLTPAMLDRFRTWINKKKITNISLVQADVLKPEQLPESWKNFDLIVVSGMLEHLPRDRIHEGIRNLKNLLSPNGTLLLFICKENRLAHWLIKKWWKAEIYTETEMNTILESAGLPHRSFKQFPTPFGYLNHWMHIIEAKKQLI